MRVTLRLYIPFLTKPHIKSQCTCSSISSLELVYIHAAYLLADGSLLSKSMITVILMSLLTIETIGLEPILLLPQCAIHYTMFLTPYFASQEDEKVATKLLFHRIFCKSRTYEIITSSLLFFCLLQEKTNFKNLYLCLILMSSQEANGKTTVFLGLEPRTTRLTAAGSTN